MPQVSIYVHGTLPPRTMLTVPFVNRFFRCPPGLTLVRDIDDSHIKDALTRLCKNNPDQYPLEHCHVFGWSGGLQHEARKDAAFDLYKCLSDLKKKYALEGVTPSFQLLTHSHGGNVALLLKKIADIYDNPADLSIDELILLACPVQTETVDYSGDPFFKQVYSIHSHSDILQVIDPQGVRSFLETLKSCGLEFTIAHLKDLGPLFSERHFPLQSGVKQLKVGYPHRELLHIEFLLPTFMEALPSLIDTLRNHTPAEGIEELVHIFSTQNQNESR